MGDRKRKKTLFRALFAGILFARVRGMGWVRSIGTALAGLLLVVGLAGFGLEPAVPGPPSSTEASPPPHRPRIHSFVGEVVEVQAADQKLIVRETLRDGSPKTTTFSTTPKTTVTRGTDAATLADVRANDHVTIKYREDPQKNKEAVAIRITPSAAPKPPKLSK